MTRHALACLCVVLVACTGRSAAPIGPLTAALFALPNTWGDAAPAQYALDRLDALVHDVQQRATNPGLSQRTALREVVFERHGFAREVDDTSLRFVWLPSVLVQRRGSCVGLGTLYLALAERLGWKMVAVMVPGHFYVRLYEQGAWHNLELLHAGEELPDAWYTARFPIPGGAAAEYGRGLSTREVSAVIEYDVGAERKRQRRWADAQRAFDAARTHFPEFAEAHASAGALAQLRGARAEAASAYEAALRANPNLPGVAQNVALLGVP
jgi:tetratricopeptide (TPR) repeat protein